MGYVRCSVCGKNMIDKVGGNNILIDNVLQHKKCPIKVITDNDTLIKYKELKDTIVEALIDYGSPEAKSRGLNWLHINAQINGLIQRGFSYEDILYSFKMCIERDKVFWGFGRVSKFIDQDIILRDKYNETKNNIKPVEEVEYKFKESTYDW